MNFLMTMDLCRGHMEHILISGCTEVNARSKENTIMMICALVEQTQWRIAVVSSGYDHEKVGPH
jgi:hypothetical protein